MFAREQLNNYDPSNPSILDRPLAAGRPLTTQVQGNAWGGRGLEGARIENAQILSFQKPDFPQSKPTFEAPAAQNILRPLSPSKENASPTKSSLSKKTGSNSRHGEFNPETSIWEDEDYSDKQLPEGRTLHRHAKSVTFDQAPPQVNEYEMTTPDPSSVASGSREGSYDSLEDDEEYSFDRGSSLDREDSFDASLEDTNKTPVVLPEDWRFMSPDNANTELAKHEIDVFDDYGSPPPNVHPGLMMSRPQQASLTSVDSNGQARPLPPLPPSLGASASGLRDSLTGTIERISSAQRLLPPPPQPPFASKSDIRRMSGSGLSLEDRIRLMMTHDQDPVKSEAEKQRERRMRRAGSKDESLGCELSHDSESEQDEDEGPGPAVVEETQVASGLSREAILRSLRSEQDLRAESDNDTQTKAGSNQRPQYLDPDVPIPSIEDQHQPDAQHMETGVVKEEPNDEDDLYSIPDLYNTNLQPEDAEDESLSQYSQPSYDDPNPLLDDGLDTPRAGSPVKEPTKKPTPLERISLPEFSNFGDESSLELDLRSYMTPPAEQEKSVPPVMLKPALAPSPLADCAAAPRPMTPEENLQLPRLSTFEDEAEPRTPDSVIRHPVSESPAPETCSIQSDHSLDIGSTYEANEDASEQPADTIEKQAGDTVAKPRLSSLVQLEIPTDRSDDDLGFGLEKEFDRVVEAQKVAFELSLQRLYTPFHGRFPSSEVPKVMNPRTLGKSVKQHDALDDNNSHAFIRAPFYGLGENVVTDRKMRRQRGYLMRENTRIVVATTHSSADEPMTSEPSSTTGQQAVEEHTENRMGQVLTSPRKISQPTWTAEPWNGKARRKSIRLGGDASVPKRKPVQSAVPPMPGQNSAVEDGLGAVAEDEVAEEEAEDFEDGAERGRLFVKVIRLKDLDLQLPECELPAKMGGLR